MVGFIQYQTIGRVNIVYAQRTYKHAEGSNSPRSSILRNMWSDPSGCAYLLELRLPTVLEHNAQHSHLMTDSVRIHPQSWRRPKTRGNIFKRRSRPPSKG